MGKYISLGEYNKLYKYIWIYLSIKFVTQFFLNNGLIFDQLYIKFLDIPHSPFISLQLDFVTFIIISIIIIIINRCLKKKEINKVDIQEQLIFNNKEQVMEFGASNNDYFLFLNIFFIIITDILEDIVSQFKCSIFDYWMFEMLFFELFYSKFFKTKIYKHHIFSLIFILSSGSLFNTIIIILNFMNNTDVTKIFDYGKWLIPISIIFYFFFHILRTHAYCNVKYYLEKRVISISGYLLLYGIFGFISSSICGISSTFVPCGDKNLSEFFKIVCIYKDDNENYYFESYILYFKQISIEYFGLKLFFMIIQTIFYYASTYYVYQIYKRLSPIYHICMYRFVDLIINILKFINDLINNKINDTEKTINLFGIVILVFYILGSIVYLELVELNFCNLNYYTKRKIKERANIDINISLEDISSNYEDTIN